jgi:hypothetical protein
MAAFGGLTSAQPVNPNNDVAVRRRVVVVASLAAESHATLQNALRRSPAHPATA